MLYKLSIVILSVFLWYSSTAGAEKVEARSGNTAVGSPGAPFSTILLNGEQWQLMQEGTTQVLVFTDSLCPYRHLPECESKLAKLKTLYKQFSSESRWLTVVKEYYVTKDVVNDYIKRFNIEYPATWDQGNELFSLYKINNTPYVVVIDKKGNISWRGDQIDEDLSATLARLK